VGKGLIFWVLMLLALLFGGFSRWPGGPGANPRFEFVGDLMLFVLLLLLGWGVFGAPIR
jgi:cytochrome b